MVELIRGTAGGLSGSRSRGGRVHSGGRRTRPEEKKKKEKEKNKEKVGLAESPWSRKDRQWRDKQCQRDDILRGKGLRCSCSGWDSS